MNTYLQAALELASHGFYVHPLKENGIIGKSGKAPRLMSWQQKATTDKGDIEKWWTMWPNSSIGVVYGHSGHMVVDLDIKDPSKNGVEEWDNIQDENERLDTLTLCTPSGGVHHIFSLPQGVEIPPSVSSLGAGIDIRSRNSYGVVPPSTYKEGSYYWDTETGDIEPSKIIEAPEWLINMVIRPKITTIECGEVDKDRIKEIRAALRFLDPDMPRDGWVRVGMALHSENSSSSYFGLWADWSECGEKYPGDKELRHQWRSFKNGSGINIETLFKMAIVHGWQYENNNTSVDLSNITFETTISDIVQTAKAPGIMQDIIDYTKRTSRVPIDVLAQSGAIAICGAIMGQKFQGSTGLRTNIMLLNIARTGTGKDHPRSVAKRIIYEAGRSEILGGEEVFSSSGLMASLACHPSRLFLLDEFGDTLREAQKPHSTGSTFLTKLTKLFSGSKDIDTGTDYADQKNRKRVIIEYPCVYFLGSSTPSKFYGALNSGMAQSGFLTRFLIFEAPNRERPHKVILEKIPKSIIDWCDTVSKVRQGLQGDIASNPITLHKSRIADKLFDDYTNFCFDRGEGVSESVGDVWSRAWEIADKLASIATISMDPESNEVPQEAAEWAISLTTQRVEWMAGVVEDKVHDTEYARDKASCLEAIKTAGKKGIKKSAIDGVKPFDGLRAKIRQEILKDLVSSGLVLIGKETNGKRGRSPEKYIYSNLIRFN